MVTQRRTPFPDPLELAPVTPGRRDAAISVLRDAFHGDPLLRWCFDAERAGYGSRLKAYFEAGHEWHTGTGHPVQGAFLKDRLVGVAYVMDPEIETLSESIEYLEAEMVRGCGKESVERFSLYNREVEAITPEGPLHLLSLLGVRRESQGRGVGSRLLEWTNALCEDTAASEGVLLDTSAESNVRFYERFGYRVIGEARLDNIVERVMIRPAAG